MKSWEIVFVATFISIVVLGGLAGYIIWLILCYPVICE